MLLVYGMENIHLVSYLVHFSEDKTWIAGVKKNHV